MLAAATYPRSGYNEGSIQLKFALTARTRLQRPQHDRGEAEGVICRGDIYIKPRCGCECPRQLFYPSALCSVRWQSKQTSEARSAERERRY